MRVAIVGATGNVGTAAVNRLRADAAVTEIVGVARRIPDAHVDGVRWHAADIARDDLRPALERVDAVLHAAWAIQPSRDLGRLWRTNVLGTRRLSEAAVACGVRSMIYLSSVGAYSPAEKDLPVTEEWPTHGVATSSYALQKAEVERHLDHLAQQHPAFRVVRLRPGLVFQRASATHVRRLFLGPFFPRVAARPRVVPDIPGLRFQCIHVEDVADAAHRALVRDAEGPFNLAAEPPLGVPEIASVFGASTVAVPVAAARRAVSVAYGLRLSPVGVGWLDMALGVPLMDCGRAERELDWRPRISALDALDEMVTGVRDGADGPTPVLARSTGGPLRAREFLGGSGAREVL
jgi:UDP-glucose 4-epimerase